MCDVFKGGGGGGGFPKNPVRKHSEFSVQEIVHGYCPIKLRTCVTAHCSEISLVKQ